MGFKALELAIEDQHRLFVDVFLHISYVRGKKELKTRLDQVLFCFRLLHYVSREVLNHAEPIGS